MTGKAMVLEDLYEKKLARIQKDGQWIDNPSGEMKETRTLHLIDLDTNRRQTSTMQMSIPVKSDLAGDAKQGASLRDKEIEFNYYKTQVWDNGTVVHTGDILRILSDRNEGKGK